MDSDLDQALGAVGPRLRALRRQRETTLANLSGATGISVSTLSQLESGARRPGGIQAYKLVIPAGSRRRDPELQTHEGYEWLYVLNGRLRLVLAEHDLVLAAGEAAEFNTRVPHWFGAADPEPVEFLSLFGSQGERAHLRARPRVASPRGRAGEG